MQTSSYLSSACRSSVIASIVLCTLLSRQAHGQTALDDLPQTIAMNNTAHTGNTAQLSGAQQGPRNPELTQQTTRDPQDVWRRRYLFGDWNGKRTQLEQKGLTFGVY